MRVLSLALSGLISFAGLTFLFLAGAASFLVGAFALILSYMGSPTTVPVFDHAPVGPWGAVVIGCATIFLTMLLGDD